MWLVRPGATVRPMQDPTEPLPPTPIDPSDPARRPPFGGGVALNPDFMATEPAIEPGTLRVVLDFEVE